MILINNLNDSLSMEYFKVYFLKMGFVAGNSARLHNKFEKKLLFTKT